jgi:hypothetical protein
MSYRRLLTVGLAIVALGAGVMWLLSGLMTSQAVQNPTLSLDMVTAGNTYSDPGGGGDNSMTVGAIDNCLTTAAPGNNNTHIHPVHVIVRNVEDLIGWQIRMNYDGGKMRPASFNFAPFTDTSRGQNVSFVNLPIDPTTGTHRGVFGSTNIPAAGPGPQTALAGSIYEASQNAQISPDTPPKLIPDDTSYSAPTGGVVATLNLQVLAGNAGDPSLFMNLDDNSPNPPGSSVVVFTPTGQQTINLSSAALGDGFHGEGATCVPIDCTTQECPSGTPLPPTPTPSPVPTTPAPTPPPPRDPRVSLDMDPSGNTYADSTNTMTVGSIENCLTSATANPNTHTHTVHLVVENVNDLVGWQARMNYLGDEMRPDTFNSTPFIDSNTGQNVSFVNLPIDQATQAHRAVTPATSIPPSAPGPQTALIGSVYSGPQNFPISPDTPPKSPADDTSYSAPSGGVLAALNLQVVGNESGRQSLFMNLDDNNPNAPGSTVIIFTGSGTQTIELAPSALGDGYHGEGTTCVPLDCVNAECPGPATPTPTATPPSVAGHDARLSKISGVPKNVRLSPGSVVSGSTSVVVANDSSHTETIGVYVDLAAPPGCSPNTRVHQSTVTLAAGAKTTLSVPVNYSCMDPASVDGQSYNWTAVADHGADDLASCPPGALQSMACSNALANDDADPADNRTTHSGPKVVAR